MSVNYDKKHKRLVISQGLSAVLFHLFNSIHLYQLSTFLPVSILYSRGTLVIDLEKALILAFCFEHRSFKSSNGAFRV